MRALVLSMLVLGACAPNTVIRRTALINAPQAPSREGLPLAKGDVRITGHINSNTAEDGAFFFFEPGIAEVGDPGVLIPEVQIGGSVWFGLPAGLELGGQIYYAAMSWAQPNVFGVLPFPEGQEEDLLMGGIGMRLNIDVGQPQLAFALLAEINVATIPEAIFVCDDPERCDGDRLTLEGEELYRFDRIEREVFFQPNVAMQLGYRFGSMFEVPADGARMGQGFVWSVMPFLSLGAQASVTNTGFEDDILTLAEDSLETFWVGYATIGVDALLEKFVLGASFLMPFESEDAIDFGVVFNFRVGVQL